MYAGYDSDGEQSLSKMFFEAKSKGISEDSYADWQAIVAKECELDNVRNFSFKASKRIFRIKLARGDYAQAQVTFERLVSFIPRTEFQVVFKAFSSQKPSRTLLHAVCPKLDLSWTLCLICASAAQSRKVMKKFRSSFTFTRPFSELELRALENARPSK